MVDSVQQAMTFLSEGGVEAKEPRYVLKCMGLDENRGDMTLYPLKGDDGLWVGGGGHTLTGNVLLEDVWAVFRDFESQPFQGVSGLPHLPIIPLERVQCHIPSILIQAHTHCPYVFQEYIPGQGVPSPSNP
jgi:hypothetical protein